MSERKPIDIELLITRHLDGELSGEDVSALQGWLRADPANADAFVRRMIDHQRLHELSAVEPMVLAAEELELIDAPGAAPLGGVHSPNEGSGELLRDLLAMEQGQEAAQPVDLTQRLLEERLADRRAKAQSQQRHRAADGQGHGPRAIIIPKSVVWLSVAAALGLLASVVWFNQPEKTSPTTPPITQQPAPQQAPAQPARPVRVATVTGALDARLADGRAVTPGTFVYNQPFDLAQGILQLQLTSGVTLTLEGPARLSPTSDMFVSLDAGKVVGLVPENAHGFLVRTPTMDVVDLGTEFGIEVDAQRGSAVHVLDGSVRLEPGRYAQRFEPVIAEVGHALTVADEGTPTPIDTTPTAFYREVPSAYERLVRDARPLAYWRFDSQDAGGRLAGLGTAQAALRATTSPDLRRDTPLQNDADDRALWLGTRPAVIDSELPFDLDTHSAFTLEAWVWVPSGTDRRMRIVSNNTLKPDGSHANGFGLGVSGADGDRLNGAPVLLFTGYTVFDAYSRVPLPTDRWTHVSVSLDGRGTLRMTIDGRRVEHRVNAETGRQQHPGFNGEPIVLPSNQSLRVGNARVLHDGPSEHWTGGIDEVAVYPRVLDEEELAAHARPDAAEPTRTQPPAR